MSLLNAMKGAANIGKKPSGGLKQLALQVKGKPAAVAAANPAKAITDAAKPFGGLRPGGKTRDVTIGKKPKTLPPSPLPVAKTAATKSKPSPAVGAMVGRFMGAKKPLVLQKKAAPAPVAPAPAAPKKADKLKRMSQQITRGTRAANPNPFKK
jgi:hypothetical protein